MDVLGLCGRALFHTLRAMPVEVCSDTGAALAPLARLAFPEAHKGTKEFFAKLRPDWADDPAALEAAARRLWTAGARTYAEFAATRRIVQQGRVTIENVERFEGALASGRPVIVTFVHTGNWEVSGMDLAFRYAPPGAFAIYDPPKRKSHEEIAMQVRKQMPCDFIAMSPMVWREALKRLRKPGGVMWTSLDDFSAGRVAAPFFGRPLRFDGNMGKIARIALRTEAIVVPFYSERHPGPRFTTHILEPLIFEGTADDGNAVYAAVRTLETTLSPWVIKLIDQWYYALMYRDYASLIPDDPSTRA